jgi:hypothetical protein
VANELAHGRFTHACSIARADERSYRTFAAKVCNERHEQGERGIRPRVAGTDFDASRQMRSVLGRVVAFDELAPRSGEKRVPLDAVQRESESKAADDRRRRARGMLSQRKFTIARSPPPTVEPPSSPPIAV